MRVSRDANNVGRAEAALKAVRDHAHQKTHNKTKLPWALKKALIAEEKDLKRWLKAIRGEA